MTSVRRLYVMLCGFEILPKTISTRDIGAQFILSEPISAYLLDTASGWVLLDAGYNSAHVAGPIDSGEYYRESGCYPPVVAAEHELVYQLREIGVKPEDIRHVVLSHMHNDHCGYLKLFPHARISVQRSEYDYAFSGASPGAYIMSDYDDPGFDWHLVDGDWEVLPGLAMIDTRGHTAGHQSAVIELPNTGTVVLPFDAGDLQENFDLEILPGGSVDDAAAIAAIRRIKAVVAERNAKLILFHDPVAIQATKLAPEFYD